MMLAKTIYNYAGVMGCWPIGLGFVGFRGMLANRFCNYLGFRGCWPIGFTTIWVLEDVGQ